MDLISELMMQVGVTREQAIGGTQTLFDFAKQQLSDQDFAQLKSALPDLQQFLGGKSGAGSAGAGAEDAGGGWVDVIAGIAKQAGFGDLSQLGDLAKIYESFKKLGISPEAVIQFVKTAIAWVSQHGGPIAGEILQRVLKLPEQGGSPAGGQ